MTRALILVRLSRVTDATTSPERQRADAERFCRERGWTVAGIAEDLDVSGSTDPRDRSGSGPWLRGRLGEFDAVVAQKLDRFGRSTRHVHGLFQYLDEHGKTMHTADGLINTHGGLAELILFITAWAAQMELESISERNHSAAQHNIKAGKYRGGLTPAGYRAEKNDDGAGWRLVPDEEGLAPVIRDIVSKVLAGGRLSAIIADLNRRGVQTHRDRQAVLNGKEPKGRGWTNSNLRRMLASPTLVGWAVHRPAERVNGKTEYGPEQVLYVDGIPLQRAESLISLSDYRALQALLAERKESEPTQRRAAETTLLLGVIHCGVCGRRMYRLKGGPGRKPRYRCSAVQYGTPCGNTSVPIETADQLLTDNLLFELGELPHVEKRLNPGFDHAAEIREINAQLESLAESIPLFRAGSSALANLHSQVAALSGRLDTLEVEPTRAAEYQYVPTGVTFAEHWESLDSAGRNDYLRDHGLRLKFKPGEWSIHMGDLFEMISKINPEVAEKLTPEMNFRERQAVITGKPIELIPGDEGYVDPHDPLADARDEDGNLPGWDL